LGFAFEKVLVNTEMLFLDLSPPLRKYEALLRRVLKVADSDMMVSAEEGLL